MKPRQPKETKNDALFRPFPTQIINTQYELSQLRIFWGIITRKFTHCVFSKTLKTNQLKRIVVDITDQPKAVVLPTNTELMHKAAISLIDIARKNNIDPHQTYERNMNAHSN